MEHKPTDLLKSFLRLQESRVRTYQSFDACLRDYLQSLDKAKYVEKCKEITTEFSRISQEIISIEESLRTTDRTLPTADTIRKIQELEREKLKKTVVRQAFLAVHAVGNTNIEAPKPEDYDDLAAQEAEIEELKEVISGELENIQEAIYEMEEDICFDEEDPIIIQNVVDILCKECHETAVRSHDFAFYHYCCDRAHDRAWGPSGRCIQIVASSMGKAIPSIHDIKKEFTDKNMSDLNKICCFVTKNYDMEGKIVTAEDNFAGILCEHLSKNGVPAFINNAASGTTLVIAAAAGKEVKTDTISVLVVDPRVCSNVTPESLERCTKVPESGLSYNVSSTLFCGWSDLHKLLAGKKWEALFIESKK